MWLKPSNTGVWIGEHGGRKPHRRDRRAPLTPVERLLTELREKRAASSYESAAVREDQPRRDAAPTPPGGSGLMAMSEHDRGAPG